MKRTRKIKVGIIGCGTIGGALAQALIRDYSKQASLAYLCDHHPGKVTQLIAKIGRKIPAVSLKKLIEHSDLILEAASASISAEVAREALHRNKKVIIMSVGGLLQIGDLNHRMRRSRGRLWVPSGALAGIDGVNAAREAGIQSVKLVTRKPPRGLEGAPYFKRHRFPQLKAREEKCIFAGTASQAVRHFPQNVNVAAVLSLAGIGPRRTRVEIWTSRTYRSNQHEITVESRAGRITARSENVPSPDNPKTSYLAILSARAVLREVFSAVEMGT